MNINIKELLDVVLRGMLSLVVLFLVTKMLGKKQVSQLSLFDYVIGISIGNFAAEMTINTESHYLNGTMAVVVFGVVAYFIAFLTLKSIKLRRYFMGIPTVLIEHGSIIKKNLKKLKFDINDLLSECRGNGFFDINQIEYAIMETNGKLSILPKSNYQQIVRKDLNLKQEKIGLCANVIIDKKIMCENLSNCKKTEDWLLKELKTRGKSLENILLATVDIDGNLVIYPGNDNYQNEDLLE